MVPSARLLVYYIVTGEQTAELVADSVWINVEEKCGNQLQVRHACTWQHPRAQCDSLVGEGGGLWLVYQIQMIFFKSFRFICLQTQTSILQAKLYPLKWRLKQTRGWHSRQSTLLCTESRKESKGPCKELSPLAWQPRGGLVWCSASQSVACWGEGGTRGPACCSTLDMEFLIKESCLHICP